MCQFVQPAPRLCLKMCLEEALRPQQTTEAHWSSIETMSTHTKTVKLYSQLFVSPCKMSWSLSCEKTLLTSGLGVFYRALTSVLGDLNH